MVGLDGVRVVGERFCKLRVLWVDCVKDGSFGRVL